MRVTTSTITWLILGFIWSIFMGVTVGSIGIGALFPPANLIAKPFVCPNGQMNYGEYTSNPLPTTTYTQITWYCVDNRSGTKTELSIFPMSLYAGFFYGLLIFVVVCIIWYISYRRKVTSGLTGDQATLERPEEFRSSASNFSQDHAATTNKERVAEDAVGRMKELKELRAANLISESEYEQKRAEILKEV